MENIDFSTSIDQLRNGEINELLVSQPQFLAFRDVWLQLDDRVKFVGEAGLNGNIIYRYQPENK
ncbi:hypothetical protein [Enterococcus sp. DIV0876]|uniref:hypothetical protein n=1 Tax=Enterococcus sp. DIV0876 TaxID=2774633 RepID=UPI003D2FC188